MTLVTETVRLPRPASEVWARIGDFHALSHWHPSVQESEPAEEGRLRRITLAGGRVIAERLLEVDHAERTYTYTAAPGTEPPVVSNHVATLRVREDAGGVSVVEWKASFDPVGPSGADASGFISTMYRAGLDNLAGLFVSRSDAGG